MRKGPSGTSIQISRAPHFCCLHKPVRGPLAAKLFQMKKLSLLLVLPLLVVEGCSTLVKTTVYDVGLKSVEKPSLPTEQFSEIKVNTVQDEGVTKYSFKDDNIDILWYVSGSHFNFKLTNMSDYAIKIPWDEVVYIDEDNNANKVMHSGIKYNERNAAQPASVIPRGTSFSDIVLPTDNVQWREGTYTRYSSIPGGWEETPLFPQYDSAYLAGTSALPGKTVSIMMPIIIQNVTNEYTFTFQINDLEYKEEKVNNPLLTTLAITTGVTVVACAAAVAVAVAR